MEYKKRCTQCGEVQPLEQFYRGIGRYGRRASCKSCVATYYATYLAPPYVSKRVHLERGENKKADLATPLDRTMPALRHVNGGVCIAAWLEPKGAL